jgi:glycerophosphoryl diester phosphodiesterase
MTSLKQLLAYQKPVFCFHRGYSIVAPENTLSAFNAAFRNGGIMIEFDCRLTKDNEPVILHDSSVNRTSNGSGFVSNMTMEQVTCLDFGSWFSTEFKDEIIPKLTDVLLRFPEKLFFDIELKSDGSLDKKKTLCQKVIEVLHKYKMREKVMISSFSKTILRVIRDLDDSIFLGLLVDTRLQALFMNRFIEKNGIDSIIFNHKILNEKKSKILKNQNKLIMVYTVNSKKDYDRCKKLGADCIISDNPALRLEVT